MKWWEYEALSSGHPYDWRPATRGGRIWDQLDFHLDLGCGRVKKGRLGLDVRPSPGVDLLVDLDTLSPSRPVSPQDGFPDHWLDAMLVTDALFTEYGRGHDLSGLPFPDDSIESIITHHCLEHIGDGFERLMEECYRVLKVGGVMRVIVPLFPSHSAVAEYDHKRYFMEGTFLGFCEDPSGARWTDGFAEPYNKCAFRIVDEDVSPPALPEKQWTKEDAREMRVTLYKHGGDPADPDPFAMVPGKEH